MAKLEELLMPSAVARSLDTPFQAVVDSKSRLLTAVNAISCRATGYDFRVRVVSNINFVELIRATLPKSFLKSPSLEIHDVAWLISKDIQVVNRIVDFRKLFGIAQSCFKPDPQRGVRK